MMLMLMLMMMALTQYIINLINYIDRRQHCHRMKKKEERKLVL